MKNEFLSADDELSSLSPLLHGLLSRTDKTVPEGYFHQLENDILKKVTAEKENEIDREIVEISPFIAKYLKQDDKKIPDNYFAELNKKILEGTVYKRRKRVKPLPFVKYISIAAVLGTVYLGIQIAREPSPGEIISFEQQVAQLSNTELHDLIEQNIDEFDTQLLFETGYIDDSTANNKIMKDVHQPMMSASEGSKEKPLLDKKLLNAMDDSTLMRMLNDEDLFDDYSL